MRGGGVETIRTPLRGEGCSRRAAAASTGSSFDDAVATAAEGRLEVLPFLCSPPGWAVRPAHAAAGRQRPPASRLGRIRPAPRSNATARAAASGKSTRPGTKDPLPRLPIHAWQIWNEENFFYFTKPASPGRYARLLAISHRAIHRADPRAEVVIGGLFGNPKQSPPAAMDAVDFLDRLYRVRGVKADFDAVALHPYAADAAELRVLVDGVRQVMLRHGDRRAGLYLTEIGWGSQERSPVSFEVGLRGQARELRAAYGYLLGNRSRLNLQQVVWFSWKDAPAALQLLRLGRALPPGPARSGRSRPGTPSSGSPRRLVTDADQLDDLRRRLLRRAGVEGRVGVVLDAELDRLGDLRPDLAGDQVQGHVDPGGDPGGGDDLAVLDEAAADGVGAVGAQLVELEPVRGRALSLQQPGGAEQQRAGADRGRPLRRPVDLAQPVEQLLVLRAAGGCRAPPGTRTMSAAVTSASALSATRPIVPRSSRTSPFCGATVWISQPGTLRSTS